MRTVRSLPYGGDLLTETLLGQRPPLDRDPPGHRPHQTETPLWTDPPDRDSPGQRPLGHVTCGACWDRDPTPTPTESQTGVKTLPCRNFVAGGNYLITKLTFSVFPSSVLIESEAKLTEIF